MSDVPIQYRQGYVEFYKLKFKVDQRALIPRPETELIVDEILKLKPSTLLDLGTGAGNIAISAAKNCPDLKVTATDVSIKALALASENAKFHNVSSRIEFIESDLLENIIGSFDVIATNLPYIPTERINYLDSSVKDYEPHLALDGGEDGFELYRKMFGQIVEKKIKFKLLMGEIDCTHAEIAQIEGNKYFPNANVEVRLDLAHKQRFVIVSYS